MNKRAVGEQGESKAIDFLLDNGYQILERNFHSRYGEIDIIAQEKDIIVFVEVKYRSNDKFGSPLEAISKRKINSICKTAEKYLNSREVEARFDVIGIQNNKVEHIISAFDYIL